MECSWKQREGDGKVLVAKFRSPPNSLDFVEIAAKILKVESDGAKEVQNKLVNLSFEAFLKQKSDNALFCMIEICLKDRS